MSFKYVGLSGLSDSLLYIKKNKTYDIFFFFNSSTYFKTSSSGFWTLYAPDPGTFLNLASLNISSINVVLEIL